MKRTAALAVVVASVLFIVSIKASSLPEGENGGPTIRQTAPLGATTQIAGPVVALIADDDLRLSDVEEKVLGTGKIGSVTKYNITLGTVPPLSEVQHYDAVLAWGGTAGWGAAKCEELGDMLADYVDEGGGLVLATFCVGSNGGSWIPTGRFSDSSYWVLEPRHNQEDGHQTLDAARQPGHPILADVHSLDGGSSSYRVDTTILSDAELIADWTDGLPLIAAKDLGVARRVDLNFYPPSDDARDDFWDASTDGDEILANALVWAARSDVVDSLTISPPSGDYVTKQRFDLVLIVANTDRSVSGMGIVLDGADVTDILGDSFISGTIASGGRTLRCPFFSVGMLNAGTHVLSVTIDLSDGSQVSDTVTWKVWDNTQD